MTFERISIRLVILLSTQIDYTHSSVSWNMTTYPAIFGRDVMLTCYTFHPLQNSKDCPVRQWSGGSDGRGLMYNGFSCNADKYEENVNLLSSQFSLIIKNFSITDINVSYTCSCGYFISKHKLQLDEERFQYSLDSANASITSYNDTLKIKMQIRIVYPLPNCSVYIGNRVVTNKVRLNYRKSGLFYSVTFLAEYKLGNVDCNKQPRVQCELNKEQITFQGNVTPSCSDYSTVTSVNKNTKPTEENDNEKYSSYLEIAVLLGSCLFIVVFAVLGFFIWKNRQTIKTTVCKQAVELENSEITLESIPSQSTEDAHDKTCSPLI